MIPRAENAHWRVAILNHFELRLGGEQIEVSRAAERLLALLCLRDRWMLRSEVAGLLWGDLSEHRASGALRTLLWRLPRSNTAAPVVEASAKSLRINDDVCIDFRDVSSLIARLLDETRSCPREDLDPSLLDGDLLPGCYDDWVVAEAERFRQLRLQALESMCERLVAVGHFRSAVQAGLAAVAAEPLRESARIVLVRAHLLQGNIDEALREHKRFSSLLMSELGLAPSTAMQSLLHELGGANGAAKVVA